MDIMIIISDYVKTKLENEKKYNADAIDSQIKRCKELKKGYIEVAYNMSNSDLKGIISLLSAYSNSNHEVRANTYGEVCKELKNIYEEKQNDKEEPIKRH